MSSLSDFSCTLNQPLHNTVRPSKHPSYTFDCQPCKVPCPKRQVVFRENFHVLQLPLDLVPGTNKSDAVNRGHHCLLNHLALNLVDEQPGEPVPLGGVLPCLLDHFISHRLVNVARTLAVCKIDLLGALYILSHCSVVL